MAKLTPEQLVLKSLRVLLQKALYGTINYEGEIKDLIAEINKLVPVEDDPYGDW